MKKDFTILGIESTCDETSAALLKGGREIVTNVIYSQIDEHKNTTASCPNWPAARTRPKSPPW